MKRDAMLAGLFAAACLLTGCGGGGTGGDPVDPPVVVDPPAPPAPPAYAVFQAAEVAIGQTSFEGTSLNQNGPASASTLAFPSGAAVANDGRLFIADFGNSRVLIYDEVPESFNATAAGFLGQPSPDSSGLGLGRDRMAFPTHVAIGAGKMAVVDYLNSRVLIYASVPTQSGTQPDAVVGQPDFDSDTPDCAENALFYPSAAAITPNGRLIVTDTTNNRVLIWNEVPTTVPAPAPDVVLGQADGTHCDFPDGDGDGVADSSPDARMSSPVGLWSDGVRLVVTEAKRVLVWNDIREVHDFQAADLVLGQDDFTGRHLPLESGRSVGNPSGVSSDGTSLAVSDLTNHRVLIWNTFPVANGQRPDTVLGASSLTGGATEDRAQLERSFDSPMGVLMQPDRTLVMDTSRNRVLVFRKPSPQ